LLVVDCVALCEPDLSLDRERRPRDGVIAISGEGEETSCAALQQNIATAPAENNE